VISAGRELSRAVGVDSDGILDIGESASLRQRLKDFVRCASKRGQEGHMAGWRYAYFHLEQHFPLSCLLVRWIETKTKEEAQRMEGRVLLKYLQRHAELPPLNYSFSWKGLPT